MIRLGLRFDDPSTTSDRMLEEGIFAAAEAAGIPITVAVIPFGRHEGDLTPLSSERVSHLVDAQRAGVIEVAQHGYCHQSATAGMGPRSEFVGVDADGQVGWIRDGREVLETVFANPVAGFVPPWNSFDCATTLALEKLKFRYLSAGWEMGADCSTALSYLPASCQMAALPEMLSALVVFAPLDPVVVAVMHHDDFVESGNPRALMDLKRFRAMLQTLAQDEGIQAATLSALAETPSSHLASRLRQGAWVNLPWMIRGRLPQGALLNQDCFRLVVHSLFHSTKKA